MRALVAYPSSSSVENSGEKLTVDELYQVKPGVCRNKFEYSEILPSYSKDLSEVRYM